MPATRLSTFDDWVDLFRVWQKDIGVDYPEITDYKFEAKFGPTRSNESEFAAYKGRPKLEKVVSIPDHRMPDPLLNLIVYHADTEFAPVDQQRHLFAAPAIKHAP